MPLHMCNLHIIAQIQCKTQNKLTRDFFRREDVAELLITQTMLLNKYIIYMNAWHKVKPNNKIKKKLTCNTESGSNICDVWNVRPKKRNAVLKDKNISHVCCSGWRMTVWECSGWGDNRVSQTGYLPTALHSARCDSVGVDDVWDQTIRRDPSQRNSRGPGERRASPPAAHLHHWRLYDHGEM